MFDAFGAVPKIRINSFGSVMNGVICDLRDGILRSITISDSCPYTELRLSDYSLGVSTLFTIWNKKDTWVKLIFDNDLVYEQDCFTFCYTDVLLDVTAIEDDDLVERILLGLFRANAYNYDYFVSNIIDNPDRSKYILFKLLADGLFVSSYSNIPRDCFIGMPEKYTTKLRQYIMPILDGITDFDYKISVIKQGVEEAIRYMDDIDRYNLTHRRESLVNFFVTITGVSSEPHRLMVIYEKVLKRFPILVEENVSGRYTRYLKPFEELVYSLLP